MHNMNIFDRTGNKFTNKDLRHELENKKENSLKKLHVEGSASKGSKGPKKERKEAVHTKDQRSRSTRVPTKVEDDAGSSFTQSSAHHLSGGSSEGTEGEAHTSDREGGTYKYTDLRKALEKMKAEK